MDPFLLMLIIVVVVLIFSYPTYVRPRFTAPGAPDLVALLLLVLLAVLIFGRWRYP